MSAADRIDRKNLGKKTAMLFGFLFFVAFGAVCVQAFPVAVEQVDGRVSLKNSAFYLADPTSSLGILEVSSPVRQSRFVPLNEGIPAGGSGALWLRFSLIKNNIPANAPRVAADERELRLELGRGAPRAKLFIAETITTEGDVKQWNERPSSADGSFILPEPELLPLTVYVRLDNMPSLWFEPHLNRPEPDSSSFPWMLAVQILLGLALAITLIRGMSENEEWRFWAGAILACVTISALYADNGTEKSMVYLAAMPQLLTPGLAVMLLPHLGRYMLSSSKSKPLDYMLIAMSLPGVLIALIPLVPGLGWTARLLPLAPLLLFPLLVFSIPAIRNRQKGSVSYFLFNLFPFIGASVALACLVWAKLHPLWPCAVHFGTFGYLLSGLLMAASKPLALKEKSDFFPLNEYLEHGGIFGDFNASSASAEDAGQGEPAVAHAEALEEALAGELAASNADELLPGNPLEEEPEEDSDGDEDILELDSSLQIVNASAASKPEAEDETAPEREMAENGVAQDVTHLLDKIFAKDVESLPTEEGESLDEPQQPDSVPIFSADKILNAERVIYIKDEEEPGLVILKPAGPDISATSEVEVAPALAEVTRPSFDHKALDRVENALRTPYEHLLRQLSELRKQQQGDIEATESLEETLRGLGRMLDNLERLASGDPLSSEPAHTIFNLSALLRRVHEVMLPLAEEKGITLSWFIAPGLPAFYKGNEENLAHALQFLMQGSIDAAESGAVQLTVREAAQPGQTQFTLLESGMDIKNVRRPSGWLNRAWELSSASGGSFNVDFIPGKGTSITFTLALTPLHHDTHDEVPGALPFEPVPFETEEATPKALLEAEEPPVAPGDAPDEEVELVAAADTEPVPDIADTPIEAADKPDLGESLNVENVLVLAEEEIANEETEGEESGPAEAAVAPGLAAAENVPAALREYIVVADMAASGRRFIIRRLDGLPHKLVEARNTREILEACATYPVGLIIVDADMPEVDLRSAMQDVGNLLLANGSPPVPSLCLIAHTSQSERMGRLGCTETQLKSASRTQFRQSVLRLNPHPEADPDEMLPESPLLRAPQSIVTLEQSAADDDIPDAPVLDAEMRPEPDNTPEAPQFLADTAAEVQEPVAPDIYGAEKKPERVPMLDLIVASLSDDETGQDAEGAAPAGDEDMPGVRLIERPYKIAGTENDYMDGDMVPLLPGFLVVLEDTLEDLSKARTGDDMLLMQEVSARMAGQGGTYGLNALERVARCVERASQAGDKEAMRDLSEELYGMGRRYLGSLKSTHAAYMENKKG